MQASLTRRDLMRSAAVASAVGLAAPPVMGQTPRSVLFWHFYTQPVRANYLRKMADQFEAANPGLKIAIESMPNPTMVDRLAAAKAGGALPDLVIHSSDTAIPLFASGDLLPVDDVIKELGESYFVPGLLKKTSLYNGNYLSLPHYSHSRILMYRKDRLAQAGVKPPVTWDEAINVAKAVTSAPDYYGWIFQLSRTDSGGSTVLYPMTLTAGGSFFNRHGDVTFDSEPVRAATDFLVEVTRKAGGPGVFNYNINENFNLVNSGKTSMTMDAAAIVGVAARDAPAVADQLDAVAIPHRNQVASLLQGGSLMVMKGKSKNPADAKNFAKYLLQPANHVEFLHTIPLFMFPTTVGASGPAFFEHPTIQRFKNVAEVSMEGLKVATLFGSDDGINPFASPVLNARIVEDMFARIILNNTPAPEAVKLAHDQMADLTGTLKRRLRL